LNHDAKAIAADHTFVPDYDFLDEFDSSNYDTVSEEEFMQRCEVIKNEQKKLAEDVLTRITPIESRRKRVKDKKVDRSKTQRDLMTSVIRYEAPDKYWQITSGINWRSHFEKHLNPEKYKDADVNAMLRDDQNCNVSDSSTEK
jgi:hypothetical protein